MSLTRWQPFEEMTPLTDAMDRLIDNTFRSFFYGSGVNPTIAGLPLDIVERENEYVVRASVPGFEPDQIDIRVQGDVLTLQGTAESGAETNEERYYLRERHLTNFRRSIRLPLAVNGDKASAEYKNGVLTLHLPKVEAAQPKRITVRS